MISVVEQLAGVGSTLSTLTNCYLAPTTPLSPLTAWCLVDILSPPCTSAEQTEVLCCDVCYDELAN